MDGSEKQFLVCHIWVILLGKAMDLLVKLQKGAHYGLASRKSGASANSTTDLVYNPRHVARPHEASSRGLSCPARLPL